MKSKRYKKLPEKTRELPPESIDKVISAVKSNCTVKFDESVDLNFQIDTNNKEAIKVLMTYLKKHKF